MCSRKAEEILPNSFSEARSMLIPKAVNDIAIKANHRPISLMNINAKRINTILSNTLQQQIQNIVWHGLWNSSQVYRLGSTFDEH